MADLDGDGDPDLVVTGNYFSSSPGTPVTVLLNDGTGAFTRRVSYQPDATPRDSAVGDITGDGVADIVVAGAAGITTLVGDGAGGFTAGPRADAGSLTDLSLGDLDGDGDLDVVAVRRGADAGGLPTSDVVVLRGNGRGTFTAAGTRSGGKGEGHTRLVDLDTDGNLDLIVTAAVRNARTGSSLLVLPGLGTATFANPQSYSLLLNPTEAAIDDMDGNGTMDVAVGVGVGRPGGRPRSADPAVLPALITTRRSSAPGLTHEQAEVSPAASAAHTA